MDTTRNSSTSSSSPALHMVMCPWLAFGHMLAFMNLAERLASRGHRVTFVSTPRNILRLPPVRQAAVSLVALPFPHVDGQPDGTESTHDVPQDKIKLLWKAFDGLAAPYAEFFGARDCIIFDIFHYWAAATAREYKVPGVMFQHCSAYNVTAWDRSWREKHASRVTEVDENDVSAVHRRRPAAQPPCTSEMTVDDRGSMALELCTLAAVSSCQEWEPELVSFMATNGGKPVVLLGLLPPLTDQGRRRCITNGEIDIDVTLIRWLDEQPPKSVVYVALGSEVPLHVEQVHELALGLELAGMRFLWALRKPRGGGIPREEDILPPWFLERTHGRGLVALRWVPQISILAHHSVGAFLTHCGWGSTIEGPLFALPLIMLPIAWDQWSKAQLLEGKKVGVQVPRSEKERSWFSREGVASAVRLVMTEVESRKVANAKKLQAIVSDRELQDRYIERFIKHVTSYKEY